jgi:SPP1 family predicted phage head-tail adaptor
MTAGLLRHRVTLQSRVDTVDDIGQPSTSWLTTATLWADVRYLSGLSAIKSAAEVSINKVSIRLRNRTIDAAQRIVYADEVFDIQAVLPDGKRQWVDLVCVVTNADV